LKKARECSTPNRSTVRRMGAGVAVGFNASLGTGRQSGPLTYREQPQIAVVAAARELVGFLWAVMRDLKNRPIWLAVAVGRQRTACAA
jgi:hypothetical protein